jgi:nitrogen fixation-related uncharacterized protein
MNVKLLVFGLLRYPRDPAMAQLVVSEGRILYPYLTRPEILICMSQEAYEKFEPELKDDGVLLGYALWMRRFGGEVHTMGVMFLIFNPLPYMDATAAWAFRSKWRRVLVGASGMITELFIAAIAVLVWAVRTRQFSDQDRLKMVVFAQEELGKNYGRLKAIVLGLKILLGHDLDKRDHLRREKKLFCSEYVARVYNFIGLDLNSI